MAILMAIGAGRGDWSRGDSGRGGWGRGGWGEGSGRGEEGGGVRGRHGRGPRGRMFGGGELRLLLLRLIADQSRHGYELIKTIEELTGGEYAPSPGVVYPTLSLLADEGKIADAEGSAGPRKAFTVTDEGLTELVDRDEEAKALIERLKALAVSDRAESPPIKRAVANLFTALRQRGAGGDAGGGFDKEVAHQIADILDEAARKIERL